MLSRRRLPNRLRYLEDQKAQGESKALERFQTRDWKAGDVYAPHDLSPAEMKKWGKRKSPSRDAFDALNLNPLDLYKVRIIFEAGKTADSCLRTEKKRTSNC